MAIENAAISRLSGGKCAGTASLLDRVGDAIVKCKSRQHAARERVAAVVAMAASSVPCWLT